MSEQGSRDMNICPELTFLRIRMLIKMGTETMTKEEEKYMVKQIVQ